MIPALRLYDRDGVTLLNALPDPIGWDAGFEFGDVGALSLDYPMDGVGAADLAHYREIALVDQGGEELENGRFVILTAEGDRVPNDVVKVTARSVLHLLSTALIYPDEPSGFSDGATPAVDKSKRVWTNATPGAVMAGLISDAVNRGALAGLSFDFTETHDSAGQPWPETVTIEQSSLDTILTAAKFFIDNGYMLFSTRGRKISAYTPASYGVDRTVQNPPVVLAQSVNVSEAPESTSAEKVASVVLALGDENKMVERSRSDTLSAFGRIEVGITASGITDLGLLGTLANRRLDSGSRVERQTTVGVAVTEDLVPGQHYRAGDFVTTVTDRGIDFHTRVQQITLSSKATASTVVGDRIYEREVRQKKADDKQNGDAEPVGSAPGTGSDPSGYDPSVNPHDPANPGYNPDSPGNAEPGHGGAVGVYVQPNEPTVVTLGTLWYDTDEVV